MALVGVLVLGSGVAAVFRTKGDTGPTTLILVGSVLFAVAAGGYKITGIKIKDAEITLAQAAGRQETLSQLENGDPAEALASLNTAAAYDPEVLSDPQIKAASKRAFRDMIWRVIRGVAEDGEHVDTTSEFPFDLVLSKGEARVFVKVWSIEDDDADRRSFLRSVSYMVSELPSREGQGLLVVASGPVPEGVEGLSEESRELDQRMEIVPWRSELDIRPIREAVVRLLS